MIIRRVVILGGTGFVGQTLANRLSAEGYEVRILTRSREQHRQKLILLPKLELIQADVHNIEHLRSCFADCDAVINLVGILNEPGRKGEGFDKAHVQLAEKIATVCEEQGIRRVLQMSALNADAEKGSSFYLKSKGRAEDLLFNKQSLLVSCYRPSIIFGTDDSFFNRFASLLKLTPLVFPLACPEARFAPVYVNDVAEAMIKTLNDSDSYGKALELCGPEQYSLLQLVNYTKECLGLKRKIIPLNDFLSRAQAAVFDFIPGKPFSTDNYLSAKSDSVCQKNAFPSLAMQPKTVESIVPEYLQNHSMQNEYDRFRKHHS